MRAFLDACVLFPPVMREALLAAAEVGVFEPLWAERVLGEWQRAAGRDGPVNAALVEGEIARLKAKWPEAMVPDPGEPPELWLPDPADVHVLAAARAGGAEVIVTMNLKDFPRRELAPWGMSAVHPDAFLRRFWDEQPEQMTTALRALEQQAQVIAVAPVDLAPLLKRARMPRLAKAWAAR